MPWAIIWNTAPLTPQCQYSALAFPDHAARPRTTKPMWLTEVNTS